MTEPGPAGSERKAVRVTRIANMKRIIPSEPPALSMVSSVMSSEVETSLCLAERSLDRLGVTGW